MANQLCECNIGILNSGLPNCVRTQKAIRKSIFVQMVSNGGVTMSIDPATVLNKAWMDALVNHSDKSLRFYPTPQMKNVDTTKTDPVMESFEDASSFFIRDGVSTFSGIFANCPPMFKAKLESMRCVSNTGKFDIDLEGNLIGLTNNIDGKLYPIPVNVQSVVAKVVNANDKATQQILFTYEIPSWVNDADFRMISASAFTNFTPLDISGLLDANVVFSAIGAGTVTATITVPSASMDEPIAVEGLVIGDFISSVTAVALRIRNVTGAADVVVTGVTEPTPGAYVLTYALVAAQTVIVLAKKNGFDFSGMRLKSYVSV